MPLLWLCGCRQSAVHAAAGQPRVPANVHNAAAARPESDTALLGKRLFFDAGLSASGKESCATCHSPEYAYGPPNARAVQLGGPKLSTPGGRAVPSLRYTLARTPRWAYPRPTSEAERLTEKDNGPAGGFTWDGRFNTLHEQAAFPLQTHSEMASSKSAVARRIAHADYAAEFRKVFGADSLRNPDVAFADALMALERFELEDASFHPYTSKYDRYLDGKATLTPQEHRGLMLFNDPTRGNCASCHLSSRGADGSHPLFTDYQFEAIGVPRNPEIPANRDPGYYDLGLCGPIRKDEPNTKYCGMFKTPTLRNVASRRAFFHNGRFHSLREALRFYVERDTNPEEWYPHGGRDKYDDIPRQMRGNVDVINLPLTAKKGDKPLWNSADIDDVIAFLKTLNDADVQQQ